MIRFEPSKKLSLAREEDLDLILLARDEKENE